MNWEKLYAALPSSFGPDEYLKQVGHTVGGIAIPEAHYQLLLSHVIELLDLRPTDRLADICCGNGLFTKDFATSCASVVGIDFSPPLLEIANRDHRPSNVHYLRMNANDIDLNALADELPFDKVVLFAALQHFRRAQLKPLLETFLRMSTESRVIVLGFVPDVDLRWQFYDTPRRKIVYGVRKLLGRDLMGTWWDRTFVADTCRRLNLRCSFHDLDPALHAARYRFSARIS